MAWTDAWKFSGALPDNGRWSSGTQTYIFIHKTCYFPHPLALQQSQESALAVFPQWKHKCEILLLDPCTKDLFKAESCWHWSRCHFCTEQYMQDPGLSPAPCLLKPNWNSSHTRNTSIPTKPVLGWKRRLSLSLFFSFLPSLASSLAEPQDLEGGSRGGLGRAATSQAYPWPHFDLQYCLLISTSQMLLSSATKRQIPEGEGSVVGREEMKAEKSCIY